MSTLTSWPTFIGKGAIQDNNGKLEPWQRNESEPPITDPTTPRHPCHYLADDGLVAAVNTALLLHKPLLVTGNPGTGKTDLAERIAWEFKLGPVLRFEAQSLSEANDLFYRFDLVGRLAESRLQADRARGRGEEAEEDKTHPLHFIEFGPFGKAILRAGLNNQDDTELLRRLRQRGCPEAREAQASVVLIDEIDKASRDFPNDLLNGIERMEFRIRELNNLLIQAPDPGLRPIVIITSNLERDLPPPFLRRCAFYHIPDPDQTRMAEIVRARVFPNQKQLPKLYQELLAFFLAPAKSPERSSLDELLIGPEPAAFAQHRQQLNDYVYQPGTTEMIEAAQALARANVDAAQGLAANLPAVKRVVSAIAKHGEDLRLLNQALDGLRTPK